MGLTGCSGWFSVSALDVCKALGARGIARRCSPENRHDAKLDAVRFELTGPGSHGFVFVYASAEAYTRASATFEEVSERVFTPHDQEPHLFRNRKERLIVMLVHGADTRAQTVAAEIAANPH